MIERYRVDVSPARLGWIERRVADAHIGYAPDDDDGGWRYGTDARYLAEFRDYWRDHYDWRRHEAEFNALPQFVTEIDGIAIHFHHLRASTGAPGLPLVLTHGWPGSVYEFHQAMPLLAARGYDVVVPSLPGYGFSGRPPRPIAPAAIADMWRTLMVERLGYARFGAQGGDWGASVAIALAGRHPDAVAAIHLNFLALRQFETRSPEEEAWQAMVRRRFAANGAYMQIQTTRPQTIGLALADSPIGFAAWVLEKYRAWSDCGGDLERAFTKDQLITSIMTYLGPDTVQSGIWLYNGLAGASPATARIAVPTGFAAFPGEAQPPPPRSAAERRFNIVHWREMPRGGHFAAWEEPGLYADEVAGFFDRWR